MDELKGQLALIENQLMKQGRQIAALEADLTLEELSETPDCTVKELKEYAAEIAAWKPGMLAFNESYLDICRIMVVEERSIYVQSLEKSREGWVRPQALHPLKESDWIRTLPKSGVKVWAEEDKDGDICIYTEDSQIAYYLEKNHSCSGYAAGLEMLAAVGVPVKPYSV